MMEMDRIDIQGSLNYYHRFSTLTILNNQEIRNSFYNELIIMKYMKPSKLISFIPIFVGIIIIILSIIDYILNKEWVHWYATVFGIILIIVGITSFYGINK